MKQNFKSIVLLCSHNGEKYIEQQINSVLNQSKPINKLIVHDYNSEDNTVRILKDTYKNNKKVLIREFDYAINPCHSFLNSMSIIRNSYSDNFILSLIDQDDVWTKEKNKIILKNINSKKEILFHDVFISNHNLEIIKKSYYQGFWNVQRDLKLPTQFFANCVIGHTISLTSDLLDKLDLEYNLAIPMHDWHIINQSLMMGCDITFLEKPLSHYRQHKNNVLGATFKKKNIFKKFRNHGKLLRDYHDFLNQKQGEEKRLNFSVLEIIKTIRPIGKLLLILTSRIFFYKS